MPHFPKPFFKSARGLWYVEIDHKQINLGADRDEAFRQYHQLMLQPRQRPVAPTSVVAIVDVFLEWVAKHRAAETYEWYRYRLQSFRTRNPDLRTSDLRPFHVQQWVDSAWRKLNTSCARCAYERYRKGQDVELSETAADGRHSQARCREFVVVVGAPSS